MTPKKLFAGTMPFVVAKLILGGATALISVALLAILMGIGWLFGDMGMVICFLIWVAGVGGIRFAIMHYMGYLVKAGHIAVIAEAYMTGKIPANQVEYGKKMVTERFATSNIYFVVDNLVTSAVKEIQKILDKAGNVLDFIPGMDSLTEVAKFFVQISLGYIDECCFGWTFYKKEESAYKSAADGIVIYVQNWKVLLKQAAMTMLKTILLMVVLVLLIFIPIGLLFKLFKWSGLIAFLLACLIAWVVKFAFMDSYIMVQMMGTYLEVAPTTTITFDLYGKVCEMSKSFKELFKKAEVEEPVATEIATTEEVVNKEVETNIEEVKAETKVETVEQKEQPVQMQAQANGNKFVFCGQCGAKNEAGSRFCGECGSKI